MAEDSDLNLPDEAAKPQPVSLRELFRRMGWKGWLVFGGSFATILVGLIALWWAQQAAAILTLDSAWEKLEEEDFAQARHAATLFLEQGLANDQERAAAAYLIGRSLCGEASVEWNQDRRKGLYLVGSRYLQESYHHDFPPGVEQEGLYYLALSTFESGRPTASLPLWKSLEEMKDLPQADQVEHYLARVYLDDRHLDPQKGLEQIERYLSRDTLLPEERVEAQLEQAALLLRAEQLDPGIALLRSVQVGPRLMPRKRLLLGQLLLAKGRQTDGLHAEEFPATPPSAAAAELYQQAIDELMGVRTSLTEGVHESSRSIFYLAECYWLLGDLDKAELHFSEVRRDELHDLLGWAAGVNEAYVQYLRGNLETAVENFQTTFARQGQDEDELDAWIPLDELTRRLEDVLRELIRQEKYASAVTLTRGMWPPAPRDFAMDWRGLIEKRWGETLLERSRQLRREGQDDDETLKQQGLAHFRDAGEAYEKLAVLRRSQRSYADHLWEAADAYLAGHDYQRAIEIYEKLRNENPANRLARLYLKLGEAYFASGDYETALRNLDRGVRERPDDPDTYKSRLLASRIHLRRSDMDQAKQLLVDNLEQELLSPESVDWRESLFALSEALFQEASTLEAESRALGVDSNDAKRQAAGLDKLEESFQAFQEAINRLEEARQRYHPDLPMFEQRYLLAESYRQSAQWPRKKAASVTVTSTRFRLENQATQLVERAHQVYNELLEDLAREQDLRPLSLVEQRLLRNCYFARADMLFEMEDFPAAIEAYKSAANRYHDRPESLEAFVRLASCYRRLERFDDARGVLEQAKLFLQDRIPPNADYTATTRYSRDEWLSFLDLLTTL